jgi:hypothetical protein
MFVASVKFVMQGALGDDYAIVRIRESWNLISKTVYQGLGAPNLNTKAAEHPEVNWLNNSTLQIRYYDDRKGLEGKGTANCRKAAGEIQIKCVNLAKK